MSYLGENIKKLRISHGLTQAQLGEKIGVAESTVSLYEAGKREPDIETIKQIANFFGVSTDDLLGLETKPTKKVHLSPDQATDDPELKEKLVKYAKYYQVAEEAADKKISPERLRLLIKVLEEDQ